MKKAAASAMRADIRNAKVVSGAKPAHAAVPGGDYRVIPAPGTALGALLHQELN